MEKETKLKEQSIEYSDYGLISRIAFPTQFPTDKETLIQKFKLETQDVYSRIANREVSLLNPLSLNDWKHWYEIVKIEKESIGFLQFLPEG